MEQRYSWRRCSFLAVVAIPLVVNTAHAGTPDVFSGGQLSIPAVMIGNATYTDMVVTTGTIVVRPSGTTPNGPIDIYDPVTHQLTVQTVTVGAATYHNVVVDVTGLVSVGGISGADVYEGALTVYAPQVQLQNGAIFNNVYVTVTSINSPGGGMPAAVRDLGNTSTLQLTISGILFAGAVHTNAVVTVGKILAANGTILSLGGTVSGLHSSGLVLGYGSATLSAACSTCWNSPQPVLTEVPAGGSPVTLAVNTVTHKVYAANQFTNDLTIIDGTTNTSTTIPVGTSPFAVAVNEQTNLVYVANSADNTVSVIDGASNTVVATVPVGNGPAAIAVNPVTNKIYVGNAQGETGHSVTVIDAGSANATTTVQTGTAPLALAINTVTDKVYVENTTTGVTSNTLTIIDGTTNSTSSVATGNGALGIAVDSTLNRVYAANGLNDNVIVIDAASGNSATNLPTGSGSGYIAINPVTHEAYVTDYLAASVTIINPKTLATTTLASDADPVGVAVDGQLNLAFVAHPLFNVDGTLTVISGRTHSVARLQLPVLDPWFVALDPGTHQVYVSKNSGTIASSLGVSAVNGTDFAFFDQTRTPPPAVPFSFGPRASGGAVSVLSQPLGQTCTVNSASPLWAVAVSCVDDQVQVTGTVTGLTASGLVLRDLWQDSFSSSGIEDIALDPSATGFTFPSPIQSAGGGSYHVIVLTQPTGQTCAINNPGNVSVNGPVNGPVTLAVTCQ